MGGVAGRLRRCCLLQTPCRPLFNLAPKLQALAASSGFARAFEHALNTHAATRSAATAPLSQLPAAFAAVDLGPVLSEAAAFAAITSADGIQRFLVAPERGVRALVRDALQLYR